MVYQELGMKTPRHVISVPNGFFFSKIAGKPSIYLLNLPDFFKFYDNILYKLVRPSQFTRKILKSSGMAYFAEIGQASPPAQCFHISEEWQHRSLR